MGDSFIDVTEQYFTKLKEECYSFQVLHCVDKIIDRLEKDSNQPSVEVMDNTNFEIRMSGTGVAPSIFMIEGEGATEQEQLNNLIRQENKLFINLLFQAASVVNKVIILTDYAENNDYTKSNIIPCFEQIQYEVEKHRFIVEKFLVGVYLYNRIEQSQSIGVDDLQNLHIDRVYDVSFIKVDIEALPIPSPVVFALTEGRYMGIRTVKSIYKITLDNGKEYLALEGQMAILNARTVSCGISKRYCNVTLNMGEIDSMYKLLD